MTRVIVVEVDGRLMGMVVDSASQVVRIPADQIDPPPPVLGGFSQEFITGVGKLDDKLIILLNTDAILTIEEMKALGSLDAAEPAPRAAGHSERPRQPDHGNRENRPGDRTTRPRREGAAPGSRDPVHGARIFAAFDEKKKSLDWLHGDLFDSRLPVALSALEATGSLADARSALRHPAPRQHAGGGAVRRRALPGKAQAPGPVKLLYDLVKTTRSEKLRREILDALAAAAPQNRDVVGLIRQSPAHPWPRPPRAVTRRACSCSPRGRSAWRSSWSTGGKRSPTRSCARRRRPPSSPPGGRPLQPAVRAPARPQPGRPRRARAAALPPGMPGAAAHRARRPARRGAARRVRRHRHRAPSFPAHRPASSSFSPTPWRRIRAGRRGAPGPRRWKARGGARAHPAAAARQGDGPDRRSAEAAADGGPARRQ